MHRTFYPPPKQHYQNENKTIKTLQQFNESAVRIKEIPSPKQANQVKRSKLIIGKRIWHYSPYKTVKYLWGEQASGHKKILLTHGISARKVN